MSSMMTTIKTPASNQKRDVRLLEHCRGSGPDILVPPKELLLANQVLSQSPVILIQPHNAPALRTRRKSTRAAVPVADAPTNARQNRQREQSDERRAIVLTTAVALKEGTLTPNHPIQSPSTFVHMNYLSRMYVRTSICSSACHQRAWCSTASGDRPHVPIRPVRIMMPTKSKQPGVII